MRASNARSVSAFNVYGQNTVFTPVREYVERKPVNSFSVHGQL
jgi:hypothetical protein